MRGVRVPNDLGGHGGCFESSPKLFDVFNWDALVRPPRTTRPRRPRHRLGADHRGRGPLSGLERADRRPPPLPGHRAVRNWDYRYAWPRDASIGVAAFLRVGKLDEARGFLGWLLHASRLQ